MPMELLAQWLVLQGLHCVFAASKGFRPKYLPPATINLASSKAWPSKDCRGRVVLPCGHPQWQGQYKLVPNRLEDPETYYVWTLPYTDAWNKYKVDGQNLGILFAAKKEFTWIVDLRFEGDNHEEWSTGNLIAPDIVFSTCKALKFLRSGLPRVTFCHVYLWEYMGGTTSSFNIITGAARGVKSYHWHPYCEVKTLEFDYGTIKLSSPISLESGISFMPINENFSPLAPNYPVIDLSHMNQQKVVCYVASFGRPYANFHKHLVLDYKVRYRVYWEEWTACEKVIDKICDSKIHDCPVTLRRGSIGRNWMCFRTRARVGTVCDHDRGSPLVCDGEVVGLVTLGAKFEYCNNRFPLPFIVARIKYDWVTQSGLVQREP